MLRSKNRKTLATREGRKPTVRQPRWQREGWGRGWDRDLIQVSYSISTIL